MNPEQLTNYFLLDVRTPQEFNEGHIPNSILIPMNEIPQNLLHLKQIKQPILIICRSGARAQRVKEYLQEEGIDSEILQGGIIANPQLLK